MFIHTSSLYHEAFQFAIRSVSNSASDFLSSTTNAEHDFNFVCALPCHCPMSDAPICPAPRRPSILPRVMGYFFWRNLYDSVEMSSLNSTKEKFGSLQSCLLLLWLFLRCPRPQMLTSASSASRSCATRSLLQTRPPPFPSAILQPLNRPTSRVICSPLIDHD